MRKHFLQARTEYFNVFFLILFIVYRENWVFIASMTLACIWKNTSTCVEYIFRWEEEVLGPLDEYNHSIRIHLPDEWDSYHSPLPLLWTLQFPLPRLQFQHYANECIHSRHHLQPSWMVYQSIWYVYWDAEYVHVQDHKWSRDAPSDETGTVFVDSGILWFLVDICVIVSPTFIVTIAVFWLECIAKPFRRWWRNSYPLHSSF